MPSQADLAESFARMRQNNAAAGSGIRNGAIDLGNVYGNHLGDAPSIPPISFGGADANSDSQPLWMKALTGLFAPGKVITNQIANWTDHKLDWKDIPTAESFVHGLQGQMNAWGDGKLGFGDIPGLGAVYGIGDKGKSFGDTLTNLGATPGGKVEKWGGLAGDMVLDPLNLFTLGGGSAIKAGAKAAQIAGKAELKAAGAQVARLAAKNVSPELAEAAGKQAIKDSGLAGRIAAQNVPGAIADATKARYAGSVVNPDLITRLAGKKAGEAQKIIDEAGAAARNTAQNSVLNFDVPFTKITKQFGQKANIPLVGKYLHKADSAIGATGAAAVANAFSKAGFDLANPDHVANMQKILKSTYGVDNAAEMTTQGLKHLQDSVDGFASKFTANDGTAKNFLNGHTIDEVMQNLFHPNLNKTMSYHPADINQLLGSLDPRIADRISPMLQGMSKAEMTPEILGAQRAMLGSTAGAPDAIQMLGEFLGKMPGSVKGNTAKAIEEAMGQAAGKVADLEHTAKVKYDPFTTSQSLKRTVTDKPFDLNTADEFTKSLDNFVQDAGGKSALGRTVAKVNPFDARAFKSEDVLARQSANDVRDATTKINGQTRQANEQIAAVYEVMQGMSDAEKRAVIYETQNHYPKGFDKASVDAVKVKAASDKVKAIMDQIGQRDLAAGGIKELRNNYFPHVLKKDGNVEQLMQDPDIARILGMNKSNNFGKARKGFQTIAQLDEVVAGLEKAAKTEADPAKAEKLLEKADSLKNLFDTNVTSALGTRAYKSVRSSAYANLFSQLEKDGLMVRPSRELSETKVHADSNPESFHKLNADEAKVLGVEAGTMIHKDTFEGMQRVHDLFTAKGMNTLVDNVNSAVSVWKSLVTSYVPAHYVNNFLGNIANNTLAGVKPQSYRDAYDLLKRVKSGSMSPEDTKIVQAAYDKGVFGAGFDSDFVKSQFKTDKKTLTEKLTNSLWAPKLKKIGNQQDDFARLSLFMHGMKETGSTEKAAAMVRKYLFNYSERSHGDTFARAAMPFWMWTKNNLPLQIQGMMQQPRYYETYKKIKDTFNQDVEGGQNKPYTTDNYMHLPGTNIGLSTRALPMNDLGNMFGTGAGDTLRSALGMLAPPLKMPWELGLNRQAFSNTPVYYKGDEAKGVGNYLLNQTGVLGKAANIADGQGNTLLEILGSIIGKPVEYK